MDLSKQLVGATSATIILAVVAEEARHGYDIVKRVNDLTGGAFQWREGTIYPALHRLERQGFIKGEWKVSSSGRDRRIYRITAAGRKALSEQRDRWTAFASNVNKVLEGCHAV